MAKVIQGLFTPDGRGAKGVPNSPINFESQRGRPSWYPTEGGIGQNLQKRSSPYGDSQQLIPPQEPVAVRPTDPAMQMMAPDWADGATALPWMQQDSNRALAQADRSYAENAPAPASAQPLGTSFSVGSSGRDTPNPGNAKS
jgi:hypothetical protein